MVSAEKYLGTGTINHAVLGSLIQGGDTGGSSLWGEYVGDNPLHGMGPRVIPKWVGATDYGTSTTAASWRKMEEPLLGVDNPGGGLGGGIGICPEEAKYGRVLHCNTTDYKPL